MDNVIAIQAAIGSLTPTGADAMHIQYAKALVAKAVEQQVAECDSRGHMYSRSSAIRAASSAPKPAANPTVANVQNCPPPQPRQQQLQPAPALSTNNGLRPPRNLYTSNGERVDARQFLINNQQWQAA
jgi:hypothetical protein